MVIVVNDSQVRGGAVTGKQPSNVCRGPSWYYPTSQQFPNIRNLYSLKNEKLALGLNPDFLLKKFPGILNKNVLNSV